MVAFVFSLNISLFVCLQLSAARIAPQRDILIHKYLQLHTHTLSRLCICSCHSRLHTSCTHTSTQKTPLNVACSWMLMNAGRWLINYPRIILPRKLPFVSSQQCIFLCVPLYAHIHMYICLYLCLYLHICLTGFPLDAVLCPGANNTLCVSLCVAD